MKKNILVIAPYFYPEGFGLENYAFQISKKLVKLGYKINVITAALHTNSRTETIDGIKIHRIKPNFTISNTPIRFSLLFSIINFIKNNDVDLIHAHTPVPFFADMAAIASKIKKIPFIVTYHASSLKKGITWIDTIASIYQKIEYFTLKRAKRIVVVAGNIKYNLLSNWKNKIEVITPGVDEKIFSYFDYNQRKSDYFLFAGSLKQDTYWKGLHILLHAFGELKKNIPDVYLNIAGGGNNIDYYINLANELNISKNVRFFYQLNHLELAKQYQQALAVVIPTISEAEGCPTVIFEAMSTGTPVIASEIAGIPFVIKNNINGLLFKPNDANQLKSLMTSILKNKKNALKLVKQGYEDINNFYTWDKIAIKYHNIYKSIFR